MNIIQITSIVLSAIALAAAGIGLIASRGIQRMRREFFAGKSAGSLEEFIIKQNQKINELTGRADFLESKIRDLQEIQKVSIQKMGVVRYNPFKDDGGNLSFSVALLDGRDNGLVITSMHGRDQNRVYSKPIRDGKSDFTLTAEEQQSLDTSKNF
jgi:hypothetical protein